MQMQVLLQDLRYGARTLLKSPLFTVVAVVTLALGIGANTAIFSVVNAVLLSSLPYHKADQLVLLFEKTATDDDDLLSPPEAEDFKARMQSLEDLVGFQSQSVNLTGIDRPDRVRGAFVTANFFDFFDIKPIIGRTFAAGEDKQGATRLVVINQKMWRERLNGDPNIADKKVILNGEPYSVIGVISSEFRHPLDSDVEAWLPLTYYPSNSWKRDARFMFVIGRLKDGASVESARAEATTIASQLSQAYPAENTGRGAKVDLFRDWMISSVRPMLLVLFAAVAVILLIACANLANLLLARGLSRQREVAVRAALGASRWRLIRQLLTETTIISVVGGVSGVLLAYWGLRLLLRLPQNFIDAERATLDARVLLFALVTSLLTGWLFGLAPAIQLARPKLQSFLKEGGRGSGDSARWNHLRGGFVVFQVALSLLLLVGAGLLIRSFDRLLSVGVGFNPNNLLSLEYRLPRNKYSTEEGQWNFHREVTEQVARIAGVQSVTIIRSLPFSGNGGSTTITLPDRELPQKGTEPEVMFNTAMPNYFETIGIPLIRGRTFSKEDQLNAPGVVVINKLMADRFWPSQDPIGKQIRFVEDNSLRTIVGVVGDAKHYFIGEDLRPQVYSAYSQNPGIFGTLLIRTTVEPMSIAESVRQAVWKVDPDQPMWKIRTVEFLLSRSVADRKFLMTLMVIFAGLALILTVIGLYGVISYLVNQRTQEIGIRMALGAQMSDILRMVLKQGMLLVSGGVILGLLASWGLTRLMEKLLYKTSTTDPVTFFGIAVLLIVVALFACYIPARRATRVDPLDALRYE